MKPGNRSSRPSIRNLWRCCLIREILFKPGSKFSYSNPAVIFLGKIIEKLSGDDYEVYIDKNILKPLEMYRTYFDATPYHLLKYRSASYYIENGKRTEGRFDANTGITVSNSGLNSPLPDMEKYLNFLIGVRTGKGNDRVPYDTILKRSSLEEMWQPQVNNARWTRTGTAALRPISG